MTKTNLAKTIDDLGSVQAQIAELELKKKMIRDSLIDLGAGAYEGELFRLTITMPEREQLSDELKTKIKTVVEKYRSTLSHQYLKAHAPKVAVPTFTVRARTGKAVAA